MDKSPIIVIKYSKIKFIVFWIFSLLLVIVGKDMLSNSEALSNKYYVGGILSIISGSIGVLILTYLILFKIHIPILVVQKEGFVSTGKYFAWWEQVKEIRALNLSYRYHTQRLIIVELRNLKTIPIDYPIENVKLVSYTKKSKSKSKYITMTLSMALSNYKTKKVIEIMQQYKAEYDRIHKAKKLNNDD